MILSIALLEDVLQDLRREYRESKSLQDNLMRI